jgi:hypothetical protein
MMMIAMVRVAISHHYRLNAATAILTFQTLFWISNSHNF